MDLVESSKRSNESTSVYRPLLQLMGIVLAPAVYAEVFSCWAAIRALRRLPKMKRSVVFSAIRNGILFGALFSALVFASWQVNWNWLGERERFAAAGVFRGSSVDARELEAIGIAFVYLVVLGGGVGRLVGLGVDRLCVRHLPGWMVWKCGIFLNEKLAQTV
jgi:hypothetical protein